MYYHPRMFEWENGERALAAWQGFAEVWLDGLARQQQAHVDAVSEFCARQVENVRMVIEARDTAQFAAGLLSCGAPEPHRLVELPVRLVGIVMDTHRKLGELIAYHGDEMTRSSVEADATAERPKKNATNGGRATGRRRVAA